MAGIACYLPNIYFPPGFNQQNSHFIWATMYPANKQASKQTNPKFLGFLCN